MPGIKQRIREVMAEPDSQDVQEHVTAFARKKFKAGKFSAEEVNDLCHMGSSKKNANRDVHRRFRATAVLPAVYVAALLVWDAH